MMFNKNKRITPGDCFACFRYRGISETYRGCSLGFSGVSLDVRRKGSSCHLVSDRNTLCNPFRYACFLTTLLNVIKR